MTQGTSFYRAPELIIGNPNYGFEIDVWSLGCIFAELFLKSPLFHGINDFQILLSICEVMGSPSPRDLPDSPEYLLLRDLPTFSGLGFGRLYSAHPEFGREEEDFLRQMLRFDPKERLTCEELIRHSYLKNTQSFN